MKPAEETSSLTGLILLTGLATVTWGLFSQDTSVLVFAIPVIYALIIANSRGNKDIDENVRSIGITGTNLKEAIPIGIAMGLLCFIIGNLIISLSSKVTASTVPTFALSGASFIPANVFTGVNILMQFLVVAPSEEIGFRFLAPYIYNSFIKFAPVAMLLGTITWVFIHIPTYIMQGTPISMYAVLFIIGLISIGLVYYTKGIIASWVMHSVFNTLVLIIGGVLSIPTYIILVLIAGSIILIYFTAAGGGRNAKRQPSEFNL
jgi:hypothetical protein